MVRFRGQSPKVRKVGRDARYALHSPTDNPDGVGGEFLVSGWMEQISPDHPAAIEIARGTRTPLAFYALSVEEALGTTYEGTDLDPVYRRWRSS
jgi:hypothetical protein